MPQPSAICPVNTKGSFKCLPPTAQVECDRSASPGGQWQVEYLNKIRRVEMLHPALVKYWKGYVKYILPPYETTCGPSVWFGKYYLALN